MKEWDLAGLPALDAFCHPFGAKREQGRFRDSFTTSQPDPAPEAGDAFVRMPLFFLLPASPRGYVRDMRGGSPKKLSHGRREEFDTAGVLIEHPVTAGMLDLPAMFGNARPVELEIGSGKGTFLAARAAARPEINLLGIEYARGYCLYTADRVKRAGLGNVRMLCVDAAAFVELCMGDASIWRLHVYFPDPWPKTRHHRRRLIQASFVKQAVRILQPGGEFIVVTDHRDYFEQVRRLLADVPGLAAIPFPKMSDQDGELVGTNFERKYIVQGRPFHWIARMRY